MPTTALTDGIKHYPLHISIFVPGMEFGPDSLTEHSLGGSETAGLCLARELATRGHQVLIFCNTRHSGLRRGNLSFLPADQYQTFVQNCPHDVAIVQRVPQMFTGRTAAGLNLLWCHDLVQGRNSDDFRGALWNVDRIMIVSDFMREQYREVLGLPEELFLVSRNGIDLNLFPQESRQREAGKVMYVSRPERGLDVLLEKVWPRLRKRVPHVKLYLAGYDNTVDHMKPFYARCEQLAAEHGDSIVNLGSLTKPELYEHMATAELLLYPTPSSEMPTFAEVSCISLMEAMASGLPILSTARGALPETMHPNAGVLLEGEGNPWDWGERFAATAQDLLTNKERWLKASQAGQEHAQSLGWGPISEKLETEIFKLFSERNNDPYRLAAHMYRHSDVEGIKQLAQRYGEEDERFADLSREVEKHYGWFDSEEGVQQHYCKTVGPHYAQALQKQLDEGETFGQYYEASTREQRFQAVAAFLRDHQEVRQVLDYGCGHGWFSGWLTQNHGVSVTGVDVDPGAIAWAEKMRDLHCKNAPQLKYMVGDHTTDLSEYGFPFDLLLVSEVLEHVWDPRAVMENLESWVRPGGYVLLTVPYGPGEYHEWERLPFRNHVRELSRHDLEDMFAHKREVEIFSSVEKRCPVLDEPIGWWLVSYRVDPELAEVRPIDWERKLSLQAPRHTLSLNMIAGGRNAVETLGWSLNVLRPHVDEVVIGDTGLPSAVAEGLRASGARVIPASNPLEHGFETPRNEVLAASRMDMIIWVDADERVINAPGLEKYLRQNLFHGYGVSQHHFAVDANFPPDMPCRVFRRGLTADGKTSRFIGMIHEHPELGVNEGNGACVILGDVQIAHIGYLAETGRRERFARNWPLLMKDCDKYPDRLLQKHFLIRDFVLQARYILEMTKGQMVPEAENYLEKAVALYKEHFLGKSHYLNLDTLTYYTHALRALGRGVDVSWDVRLNRAGAGEQLNGGAVARFESVEEAQREIDWQIKNKGEKLEGQWW